MITIKEDSRIIIVGCGRLGASMANDLSDQNRSVTVIDTNKEAFRKIPSSFSGLYIEGDATDISVLREAGIQQADVLIAATDKDNINILVSQLAKNLFDVKDIVVRLYDSHKAVLCEAMHMQTICPSLLSERAVYKILSWGDAHEK